MVALQYAVLLLKAAGTTLWISWLALVIAGLIGGGVGLARTSRSRLLRGLALTYTEALRSVPIIVLMFFCYFGLPLVLGLDIPPFAAATIALALTGGSLMSEVVRGGIESVGAGQRDAASALGLRGWPAMRLVIGPQALRVMLPPTVGVYIATLKDSAIASIIGYVELTKIGLLIRDTTGRGFEVLACVSILYFLINYAISLGGARLERRYRIAAH